MSTISKIFVILNLLLAMAFATFAVTLYSKRVHYHHQREELKKAKDAEIARQKTEIDGLKAKKADLETKLTDAARLRDQYKGEAERLARDKNEEMKQRVAAEDLAKIAMEQKDVLIKSADAMRKELEKTRKVVVALKEIETVLRTNTAELKKERDDLKNEVNKSRQDLTELHRDRKRIAEELANAEYVIVTMIKKGYDVYKIVGPGALGEIPDVRTKVVDVRPATGHVALGAGKSSGIREGFVFLIHRGDRYVGKVRVTTVWDNFSGGTIVERKAPIKAGDDAMTDTTPGG